MESFAKELAELIRHAVAADKRFDDMESIGEVVANADGKRFAFIAYPFDYKPVLITVRDGE